MKAMILAAGLGTRLKPFTDKFPKALASVNNKSLLEINIRNLQRFGIFDVVVNVHHFADQIEEVLNKEKGFGSRYEISDERDMVLETGGGLMKAAHLLKNEQHFLVINVDILSNIDLNKMKAYHSSSDNLATLAVQSRTSSRYLLFDEERQLYGWRNVRTGEEKLPADHLYGKAQDLCPLAFSGIQFINNVIFEKVSGSGKFSLVDMYLDLCKTEKIRAWDHSGDILLDVGKPESLIQAKQLLDRVNED